MPDAIVKAFEAHQNPKFAAQMAAYMRDLFPFYGIKTPLRKELSRAFISQQRKAKATDWALLYRLWEMPMRECQYLVCDILSARRRSQVYEDIARMKPFVTTKQWWDTIDALDGLIGDLGLTDSRVDDLMLSWSTHEDFWLRRIAIDHQLGRKEKTNTALLAQIIKNNLGSKEFFVNKAIGWSLREYSKTNPRWVEAFIEYNRTALSPLSIREGSKYL
ncbi:MAG: DNA alkylation repair protein [Clostridiales bacterium]|nr:DNA alkylation repair protein [Clostridiales bacterium]